jgi:hypothetical protein
MLPARNPDVDDTDQRATQPPGHFTGAQIFRVAADKCEQRHRIHWTYYLHGSSSNPYPLDFKIREPLVLGREMAGEVVETGPGVTKISVGQRVAANPLRACRRCDYYLEFALVNCP